MSLDASKRNKEVDGQMDFSNADFSNISVELDELNDSVNSSLTMQALSANYRKMNLSIGAVVALLALAIFSSFQSELLFALPDDVKALTPFGYGLILIASAWYLIFHFVADPLKIYALREHDLNYQSGLIFKNLVSQPILRIQHVELKTGPIERAFGLATLQVFSAGGAFHTFMIPGLEQQKAARLRAFILDHKDLSADV